MGIARRRLLRAPIRHELHPDDETLAAYVADERGPPLDLHEALEKSAPVARRVVDETLFVDHVERREAGGTRQRRAAGREEAEGRDVEELGPPDHRRERQPAAERLAEADGIRHHVRVLEAEHA